MINSYHHPRSDEAAEVAAGPITLQQYAEMVGGPIASSRWYLLDQSRIDSFAQITEDEQFIHIDPIAAAATPFGGPIAHGFLSLSMLSSMAASAIPPIIGTEMAINYGFNSVRFLKPVRVDNRVRGDFKLIDLQERASKQWQSTWAVTVNIQGENKPALVAEWLTLNILSSSIGGTSV